MPNFVSESIPNLIFESMSNLVSNPMPEVCENPNFVNWECETWLGALKEEDDCPELI